MHTKSIDITYIYNHTCVPELLLDRERLALLEPVVSGALWVFP